MPVDITSDEWKNAERFDPIETEINTLFIDNKEQVFSIKEIEEYLAEDYPQLFPKSLAGDDAIDGAKAVRQSIIANILENKYWHSKVSFGDPLKSLPTNRARR